MIENGSKVIDFDRLTILLVTYQRMKPEAQETEVCLLQQDKAGDVDGKTR